MIYFLIFVFKISEDALSTLRLIVVSNGKKVLGAFLSFFVTLIWLVLTSTVLIGLSTDVMKAIVFAFGALFGSYLGSFIEEKIALGFVNIIVEVNCFRENAIIDVCENDCKITKIRIGFKTILILTTSRKKSFNIISRIKKVNGEVLIMSEKIKIL